MSKAADNVMAHWRRAFAQSLVLTASAFALNAAATSPLLIVFDEDDDEGAGYVNASFVNAVEPSQFTAGATSGQKLAVDSTKSVSGKDSVILEWTSRSGGQWEAFLSAPGWEGQDISGAENLIFHAASDSPITAGALPTMQLTALDNSRTAAIALGDSVSGGLGGGDDWRRVVIPLKAFDPVEEFDPRHFKAIRFSQGVADDRGHRLYLDLVGFDIPNRWEDFHLQPPEQVGTRVGDRTVTVRWLGAWEDAIAGYHIHRSERRDGSFARVTEAPIRIHSWADARVENGVEYFYRLTAMSRDGRESEPSQIVEGTPVEFSSSDAFLDYVSATAFDYFWHETHPATGLVRDRTQNFSASSIAAVGFGLTAIGIGVERGWITRKEGIERTVLTLRTFVDGKQGEAAEGTIGHRGWFYHFLQPDSAIRSGRSELSSIDTALLLAGVIFAREYFDRDSPAEKRVRRLSQTILERVDWNWMRDGRDVLTMGWRPESGFLRAEWVGYNEAMLLYLIGFGVANDALPPEMWKRWTSGYDWESHYGHEFIAFPPLFGHQYSHCWIDFRGIADAYGREKGLTYFENSRRATLAQRAYGAANPRGRAGYSELVWGLTACDGPGIKGAFAYRARGAPPAENDDGTIAPTAVGGSVAFAPEECIRSLRHVYDAYRERIWTGYGFRDSFNPGLDWFNPDVLGIDQGPILLMIENHRSGLIWKTFMNAPEIQRGLRLAGFEPFENEPVR